MKEKMTIQLKNQFPPSDGQYGTSQGAYVITPKGEFKCYNSGPTWFTDFDKGHDIEVVAEWKQNKTTQAWYLSCSYGQAVTGPQGPPQGPPLQNAPQQQTPPQQPQRPAQPPQQPARDVQDDIRWAQAINVAFSLYCSGKVAEENIQARHGEIYTLLKTRKFAPWMCSQPESFNDFAAGQDQQDGLPPTDYDNPDSY